eukprot:TRINITY_DN13941_c0_g1_i1.p2 TRINITY_DN13941_c0_g1~~TRINITY_DN13941_c0_g1_i1.p2  ORF type:complete len:261 (+),score=42.19 TRINITY_DN13941_c0_g1_i1:88-783(+)
MCIRDSSLPPLINKKLSAPQFKIEKNQREMFMNSNSFLFFPERQNQNKVEPFQSFMELKKNSFDNYYNLSTTNTINQFTINNRHKNKQSNICKTEDSPNERSSDKKSRFKFNADVQETSKDHYSFNDRLKELDNNQIQQIYYKSKISEENVNKFSSLLQNYELSDKAKKLCKRSQKIKTTQLKIKFLDEMSSGPKEQLQIQSPSNNNSKNLNKKTLIKIYCKYGLTANQNK